MNPTSSTTVFAPANRRGISLSRQAALDVVYLRLIVQRHMRFDPPRILVDGRLGYDYSRLLFSRNTPLGVIDTHWFPGSAPVFSQSGWTSLTSTPVPENFLMIRDCLGLDFMFALNDAYLRCFQYNLGELDALESHLKAVAITFGLEIPTEDSVLYMRSRRVAMVTCS
jgi:hypothetical protein